jgi:aspartate racemase
MSDAILGRCIGLIGGLGVGATVHYYQELAKAHTGRGRVLNLVMAHADVNRVLGAAQAGDKAGLAEYLAALIGRLASAGAEFAAIPAVTPHICIAELLKLSPLPIVNPIQELQREIEELQCKKDGRGCRVALFGTRFTMESGLFGLLQGVEVVAPAPAEIDFVHQTYLQLVSAGTGSAEQRDSLSRLARGLIERDGVDAVILAGTELALVFNKSNTDFPHLDCGRLHLDAIVQRALTGC